jgi:hypothetical protein
LGRIIYIYRFSDSVDMNEAVGGQECLQSILVYYHPVRTLKSHSDFFTQWRNEFKRSKVKRWFNARIQGSFENFRTW